LCENVGVENIGDAWHRATAERVGKAVARFRKDAHLTAQQLAERCKELGAPIHRTTITKIEGGRSRFDLGEWLILAAALNVPPVVLLYPDMPDGQVEIIPGETDASFVALGWVTGQAVSLFSDKVTKAEMLAGATRRRFDLMVALPDLRTSADDADERVRASARLRRDSIMDEILRLEALIRECGGYLDLKDG
jgi:transcriptional regulator with XRE-family HTH domain